MSKEFNEDPLAGMTVLECPVECTKDRCVITEWGICGHPKKSGLQGNDRMKPETVKRFNDARRRLLRDQADKAVA